MPRYKPIRGPDFADSSMRDLIEWLENEHQKIRQSLDAVHDHEGIVSRTQPDGKRLKDRAGMLRWGDPAGDGTDPDIEPAKFNYFDGIEWKWLGDNQDITDLALWVITNFSVPGYGGLRIATPPVVIADITATWTKLTAFDAVMFVVPDAVVQNLANSSLIISEQGVWVLSVFIAMTHNESNQGRTLHVRVYNEISGVPVGNQVTIGVGRNQPATYIGGSFPNDVPLETVNDDLIIELRTEVGDTLTSVQVTTAVYSWHHVSGFAGAIAPV